MFMCLGACGYFSSIHYLAVHIYCRSGNLHIKYISSLKVRNIACICILHLNFALASGIKYFRCENFPIYGNFCLLPKVTILVCYGVWEQDYLHVVLVVLFHSVYQDLEVWHGDMQSRLRLIPDPSETLKYKPTCTAIQQLQVH